MAAQLVASQVVHSSTDFGSWKTTFQHLIWFSKGLCIKSLYIGPLVIMKGTLVSYITEVYTVSLLAHYVKIRRGCV
jgi:hypothetical protein